MPFGAIASAVAPSLIGGLFGKKSAKKERRRALQDQREQFSRIRESAEKAGFNPLTALGSAAAGGFGNLPSGTMAPLASVELAQNALRGVADVATGEKARRDQANAVQDRIQRLKLERLEAGNAGEIAARTTGAVMTRRKAPPVTAAASTSSPGKTPGPMEPGLNVDDPGKPLRVPDDGGADIEERLDQAAQRYPGRSIEEEPTKILPLMRDTDVGPFTVPLPTSDGEELMGIEDYLALPFHGLTSTGFMLGVMAKDYFSERRNKKLFRQWHDAQNGEEFTPSISPKALGAFDVKNRALRTSKLPY